MRITRAADYKVMPWKNGGGTTTEIAISPESASLDDFDWRISMAHVGSNGPFSAFADIDRTLSVLGGNGIRLVFDDGESVALDGSQPFAFAADRAVTGQLVDGPIDDLNVMSRRGRWSHAVRRLSGPGPHRMTVESGLLVLVARGGEWQVQGSAAGNAILAAGDSLIAPAPDGFAISGRSTGELFAVSLRPAD